MNAPRHRRYCLISPCRDEADHCRRTLDSVVRQSIPPALWVIVDDGSRDATPAILEEYARRYGFIRVIRREDRGGRSVGPGVVDAFYAGYRSIDTADYPYLCKLDLDLDLPPRYFETLIERMEANPRLGTCSGKAYYPSPRTGRLVSERLGSEMSAGMTKFYRRVCFEQVGGFVREVMWDGIDCHRCRMLGWQAASWDEPDLRFVHLRPMGTSQRTVWAGRMRHGYGQYYMGTSPVYMLASTAYRMGQRPYVAGALATAWGYSRAMLRREPRYDDLTFRRLLRRYQWACLLLGKASATRRLEARRARQWTVRVSVGEPLAGGGA
ncbi:MAG: glycosyltransferase family A protein [Phycisphaeraceae bacterium]